MSDNIVEFRPKGEASEAQPMFQRALCSIKQCEHKGATILIDTYTNSASCSLCSQPIEAIQVLKMLMDQEYARARRDNAALWHRLYIEQQAEKQAAKTRKAAYATLQRFGVTPEMYAEEYRRASLLNDLAAKQDTNKTLNFGGGEQ